MISFWSSPVCLAVEEQCASKPDIGDEADGDQSKIPESIITTLN